MYSSATAHPILAPFTEYDHDFQCMIGNVKLKNQKSKLWSGCGTIFHFAISILILHRLIHQLETFFYAVPKPVLRLKGHYRIPLLEEQCFRKTALFIGKNLSPVQRKEGNIMSCTFDGDSRFYYKAPVFWFIDG